MQMSPILNLSGLNCAFPVVAKHCHSRSSRAARRARARLRRRGGLQLQLQPACAAVREASHVRDAAVASRHPVARGYGGGAATTCEAAAGKRHIPIPKSLAQHALVLSAVRSDKPATRIVGSHNEPLAGGPSQAARCSPDPHHSLVATPRAPASPSASGLRLVSRLRFPAMVSYHPSLSLLRPSVLTARASVIGRCSTPNAFVSIPVVSAAPLRLRPLLRAAAGGAASPVTSKPRPPLASSYTLLATPRGMLRSSCKCLLARLLRRSVVMEANALFRLPRCSSTSRVATSSRLVSSVSTRSQLILNRVSMGEFLLLFA